MDDLTGYAGLSSRQIEEALGVPRATVAWLADRLPITPTRRGRARRWTAKDVFVLYAAVQFGESFMLPSAAIQMAREVERHFERMLDKQGEPGPAVYLVTTMDAQATGFEFRITDDPGGAIDLIARAATGAAIFNLSRMLSDASQLMLEVLRPPMGQGNAKA